MHCSLRYNCSMPPINHLSLHIMLWRIYMWHLFVQWHFIMFHAFFIWLHTLMFTMRKNFAVCHAHSVLMPLSYFYRVWKFNEPFCPEPVPAIQQIHSLHWDAEHMASKRAAQTRPVQRTLWTCTHSRRLLPTISLPSWRALALPRYLCAVDWSSPFGSRYHVLQAC